MDAAKTQRSDMLDSISLSLAVQATILRIVIYHYASSTCLGIVVLVFMWNDTGLAMHTASLVQ